jgi:autotransporter-associated beta strand protein
MNVDRKPVFRKNASHRSSKSALWCRSQTLFRVTSRSVTAASAVMGVALLACATLGQAADWTPGTATAAGSWTSVAAGTGGYWNIAPYPNGTGATARIAANITAPTSVAVDAPVTIGALTIGDTDGSAAYALAGAGPLTWSTSSGSASLTTLTTSAGDAITVPMVCASPLAITHAGAAPITLGGPISGAGAVTKSGSGRVILAGDNSAWSGGLTMSAGTVTAGHASALGTGVARIAGGTLDLNGMAIATPLASGGGTITNASASVARVTTGINAAMASGYVIGDFTVAGAGDIIWSGALYRSSGNATLTKNGSGTWAIANGNVNLGIGQITVKQGTLVLASSGVVANQVAIQGGTLKYDPSLGVISASRDWQGQVNAGVIVTSGTFDLNGSTGKNSYMQWIQGTSAGEITNSAATPADLVLRSRGSSLFTVGSRISGALNIAMQWSTGTANSYLFTNANTYTGTTTVSCGALRLGNALAVQNSTVSVGVANGLAFDTATAGTTSFTVGGLSGSAAVALSDITTTTTGVTLLVGNNGTSTTYAGALSGTGALTKIGGGTLTLSGANTYAGLTSVSAGTLAISGSLASQTVDIANGATLRLSGTAPLASAVAVTGSGTVAGDLTLGAGRTITPTGAMAVTGTLTLGAGTLVLGANPTAGSSLTVGTLNVSALSASAPCVVKIPANVASVRAVKLISAARISGTLSSAGLVVADASGTPVPGWTVALGGAPAVGGSPTDLYAVNDAAPAVVPIADAAIAATTSTVDVSASFSDADGDALTYALDAASVAAGFTISPQGVIGGFPNAGTTYHGIVVTATDPYGASVSSNAFSVTVAPLDSGDGTGLQAYYYPSHIIQSVAPALTRVDPTVDFDWGLGSPADNMPIDYFSVIWTGTLTARYTGPHVIALDGHVNRRIWIGGAEVMDNFGSHTLGRTTCTVNLVAGQTVPIWIEIYEVHDQANATLTWIPPGQTEEVIPASQFHPVPMADIVTGAGTGLRAGYFPGPSFTGTPVKKIDSTVDFTWPTIPIEGFPADYFSVRWQGKIISPLDEDTTLIFNADDGMRLWLDGTLVIDSWINGNRTLRCVLPGGAGVEHDLRIDYCETTFNAEAHLEWEGPHMPRRAVPTTSLIPADDVVTPAPTNGAGLSAAYYATENMSGTPVLARVQNVNVNWGSGSPHPAIPADHFSVRWTGQIQTRFDEDYTLIAKMDDVIRIWLDDVKVMDVDDWKNEHTYTFAAKAGQKYRLRMEMVEHVGLASAKLEWSSASEARQVIPEACLYPDDLDVAVPATSVTSPAFIEGLHGPELTVNAGTGSIQTLGESRFYVNQPLSVGSATPVQISAGTDSVSGSITWTPTQLTDADVVVRPGDTLLIQAVTAGTWQIQKDCATWREPAPIAANDQVPVTFDQPGTYLVEQADGAGTVLATLTVTVPSIITTGPIPVSTQFIRIKDVVYGDANDVGLITWISADSWAVVGVGTTPSDVSPTSKRFTVWADQNRESWMVGRIGGAAGSIISKMKIRPFTMSSSSEKAINVKKMFPDGSLLCESKLVMSPLVEDVRVKVSIVVAGVTFDDSTTLRWIDSGSDFSLGKDYGVYKFEIICPPNTGTGLCHSWQEFDQDVRISK